MPSRALTFFCDSCGQPLLLEGEPSPGLRVSCPSCQATIDVPVPGTHEPLEPSWFAMVRGSQVGPMAEDPLRQLIRAGEVSSKTFVWCEGMAEWRRAETLPQLAEALAATRPPRPANTADLSQLFSDLDLTVSRPMDARAVEQMLSGSRAPKPALPGPSPVAAGRPSGGSVRNARGRAARRVDDDDFEDSGVVRRNPAWKVALAVLLVLALPVGGLYALSSLQVLPLEVPQVDPATGASVKQPVFSARGVRGLKDLLLGRTQPPPPPPAPREVRAPAPRPPPGSSPPPAALPRPEPPASPELKKLYADARKPDVGPGAVPALAHAGTSAATGGGPNAQALAKVVAQSGPAFQACIEQQLKRTPNFRGGKVNLVATVGASGTVKQARLDRKEIDVSDLGNCLKSRARRLVFPNFEGEDVEVEIPLVLTAAL